MFFPAVAVIGPGLILFPGYKEERIERGGEDITHLSGARLLTPRWWAILIIAVLTGLGNLALLSIL
jgi:hypothetical protein